MTDQTPRLARVQSKADDVAATFNRMMRKTNDAPLKVEKVVMLHLTRELLAQLKEPGGGYVLENLPAVEADLAKIEADCRAAGLFEAYADLPRPVRRRLAKLAKG